ncbi:MAG TPA: hypothetical protein ENH00_10490 [Actinobacteria bacterium]|nr:hypothetical protein [Actinomycetota bacterium]
MVPTGYEIEDFLPLVEGYFAVRNWALEHPDQVTEEILATVIEPGSVEMRDTLAEIQDLLDQDAHYEGLTETFVLVEADFFRGETDPKVTPTDVIITVEYGVSLIVTGQRSVLSSDTLRRAPWTLTFDRNADGSWLIREVLRNPFDHAPGTS